MLFYEARILPVELENKEVEALETVQGLINNLLCRMRKEEMTEAWFADYDDDFITPEQLDDAETIISHLLHIKELA